MLAKTWRVVSFVLAVVIGLMVTQATADGIVKFDITQTLGGLLCLGLIWRWLKYICTGR